MDENKVTLQPNFEVDCVDSTRQVDQAIALCSEMHNIKEAIYENKSKLEGIGEDYQIQVGDNPFYLLAQFSRAHGNL